MWNEENPFALTCNDHTMKSHNNKGASNDQDKRRFTFLEIYYDQFQIIPEDCKVPFITALIEYGLYKTDFDFSMYDEKTCALLNVCINSIKKFIDKGWTYRENGLKGGAPRGNKNASKQPNSTKIQPINKNEGKE